MIDFKKNYLRLISLFTTLKIFKLFKLSYILGSKYLFFTASQIFLPVTGFLYQTNLNILFFLLRMMINFFYNPFNIYNILYHIPTFCGIIYLSARSNFIKFVIPLMSIFLFLFNHNIMNCSVYIKVYSLYWIVPIFILLINKFTKYNSIFLHSLGATYVIHAVGSVLWLYTHDFDVNIYYKLIFIVFFERLMFACLITIFYYSFNIINNYIKTINFNNILFNKNSINNTTINISK